MQTAQGFGATESPEEFAKRIQLPIRDYSLLSRALTHRSYLNENLDALEDNERLEFLGDAVLDFVVGAWLYNRYPEMSEGHMTRMRAALVRTEQLANFAKNIQIERALRLGHGEEEGGGRRRAAMLCAAFEAIIGALFLDAEIEAVEDFMRPFLQRAADNILAINADRDPKSRLQEWAQSQGLLAPTYEIVSQSGPDHDKTFLVEVIVGGEAYGSGTGPSKQVASRNAARDAIERLRLP